MGRTFAEGQGQSANARFRFQKVSEGFRRFQVGRIKHVKHLKLFLTTDRMRINRAIAIAKDLGGTVGGGE